MIREWLVSAEVVWLHSEDDEAAREVDLVTALDVAIRVRTKLMRAGELRLAGGVFENVASCLFKHSRNPGLGMEGTVALIED